MSALGPRGFVELYNQHLRNKEYDDEITNYKTDTVTDAEMENYFPIDNTKLISILQGQKEITATTRITVPNCKV